MATCIATKEFGFVDHKAHLEKNNDGTDNLRGKYGIVMAIIAKGNIIEGIKARY